MNQNLIGVMGFILLVLGIVLMAFGKLFGLLALLLSSAFLILGIRPSLFKPFLKVAAVTFGVLLLVAVALFSLKFQQARSSEPGPPAGPTNDIRDEDGP